MVCGTASRRAADPALTIFALVSGAGAISSSFDTPRTVMLSAVATLPTNSWAVILATSATVVAGVDSYAMIWDLPPTRAGDDYLRRSAVKPRPVVDRTESATVENVRLRAPCCSLRDPRL
jgi:hypothetical protein